MIVTVTSPSGSAQHDAPYIDCDTNDGELRVTRRDLDAKVLSWTLYAAGSWLTAELTEAAAEEVLRHRAAVAERDRVGQPANRGNGFTTPAGNSSIM